MTSDETLCDLRRQLSDLQERVDRLSRENEALREENRTLRKEVEEWRRGLRERSKRRCSRPEGAPPRRERKVPGRRRGHPGTQRVVPEQVDRTVEHPMPLRCECGGVVDSTGEVESTIVQDIPPIRVENVRHNAHVGRCRKCGRRVMGPLPGAVKAGRSVAAVQLGPRVQAFALGLRFEQHVPLAGIGVVLDTWFGVSVTPGGLSQMFDRLREQSASSYAQIEQHVRGSAVVGMDETGLRQNGVGGWVWLARTPDASLFRVELSRGAWVADAILGEGFCGVVVTDFYAAYTRRTDWLHGYCGAHLIREAKKIAEVDPCPPTEAFRDGVEAWYGFAKTVCDSDVSSDRTVARRRLTILARDTELGAHPEVARLLGRIVEHHEGILRFTYTPGVPADNNASERDIRALAVHRRVTGGTRSLNGSKTLGHWMSITQTLRKADRPLVEYVVGLYESHLAARPPPSLGLPS